MYLLTFTPFRCSQAAVEAIVEINFAVSLYNCSPPARVHYVRSLFWLYFVQHTFRCLSACMFLLSTSIFYHLHVIYLFLLLHILISILYLAHSPRPPSATLLWQNRRNCSRCRLQPRQRSWSWCWLLRDAKGLPNALLTFECVFLISAYKLVPLCIYICMCNCDCTNEHFLYYFGFYFLKSNWMKFFYAASIHFDLFAGW